MQEEHSDLSGEVLLSAFEKADQQPFSRLATATLYKGALFYFSDLVYAHVELKSHYLTKSILGEFLGTNLENAYLLVGNGVYVIGINELLEVSINVGDTIFLHVFLVGEYLCYNGIVVRAATALTLVHDNVDKTGNCSELALDLLGIYVLTVGENDKVLLSTGNVDLAARTKLAVVTRSEVSVGSDSFSCRLGILEVTEHYVRALSPDLTFAILVRLVDLDLIDREMRSNATGDSFVRAVARDDRRALGNAVAVKYLYTYAVVKIKHLLVDRRTAGNNHRDLAAECCKNCAKELMTKVNAKLEKEVRELDHSSNKLLLALRLDISHNLSVEGLEIKRNENQVTGLLLSELLLYVTKA